MQFGIFNLMGYRERGTPTTQILDEAAEQTHRADELGYDAAWFAEHHFSNYCVCPSKDAPWKSPCHDLRWKLMLRPEELRCLLRLRVPLFCVLFVCQKCAQIYHQALRSKW